MGSLPTPERWGTIVTGSYQLIHRFPIVNSVISMQGIPVQLAGGVFWRAALGALAAVIVSAGSFAPSAGAQESAIDRLSAEGESQVIAWRRDFHQNPELSNREFRTSEVVAEALREMGLEVETGIAHTGVVGYLRGAQERPLVAFRADMDALPVPEATGL
ncbi:MAG: hypothetical protein OXE50_15605, partial [Chloroflexi bacterium]|nr:hypothetical protein [Chloroflexota bacterium]